MLTASGRLVFPLDGPEQSTAQELVDTLREEAGLFKVGLELYLATGAGPWPGGWWRK